MKKYSVETLTYISKQLRERGYEGVANEAFWWNESIRSYHKRHKTSLWYGLSASFKTLPLLINHHKPPIRIIAIARLHLNK